MRRAVRGWTGKITGHSAATVSSLERMRASDSGVVDVGGPVQGQDRVAAFAAARAARSRRPRARAARWRSSVSIMTLPTKRIRSSGTPSFAEVLVARRATA